MNELLMEFIKSSPLAGAMVFVCWMLFKQLAKLIENIGKLAEEGHGVMRENTQALTALKTSVESGERTNQAVRDQLVKLNGKQ